MNKEVGSPRIKSWLIVALLQSYGHTVSNVQSVAVSTAVLSTAVMVPSSLRFPASTPFSYFPVCLVAVNVAVSPILFNTNLLAPTKYPLSLVTLIANSYPSVASAASP